jgi:hypothetical protein
MGTGSKLGKGQKRHAKAKKASVRTGWTHGKHL